MNRQPILAAIMALACTSLAVACLWDYDTLRMERSRFPTALELVTGKFLRHSPEFYRWRIADRLKKLESDPSNAAWLDDLAVAYDKTGRHDLAIRTANELEKLRPGRYETAANLGTFYFHAGDLEKGLPHIRRALQINPDAHFGREEYQMLLAEYLLERRAAGHKGLPTAKIEKRASTDGEAFVRFSDTYFDFLRKRRGEETFRRPQLDHAVKGVLGMMKFGNHESPILLEALASLLASPRGEFDDHDAKQLAARALLRASQLVADDSAKSDYRLMAKSTLKMQLSQKGLNTPVTLAYVEGWLEMELTEAQRWYDDLRWREIKWISGGENPEAKFDALYDAEPIIESGPAADPIQPLTNLAAQILATVVVLAIALLGGIVMLIRRFYFGRTVDNRSTSVG